MRTLLLSVLLTLAAGAARADDYFYLGAGVNHAEVNGFLLQANPENTRGFPDISATSWKAFIAVRPVRYLAVEADYVDLGASTRNFSGGYYDRSSGNARALYAVGIVPFGGLQSVDFLAKVGVSDWTLTALQGEPIPSPYDSESDKGNSIAWGLGLQGHFGHFGARLEYEGWSMGLTNGARVITLAAVVML